MKIELNHSQCMAHGICMEVAPAYFTPDPDGYVSLLPGAEDLGDSPELRLAEASCPMRVIAVRADSPADVSDTTPTH